jgi:translocation and assembly module TamB
MTDNSSITSRRWLKLFLKTGSAIGLGLFLLIIAGLGIGQWWAKNNLAPIVSQELTKSLKRPVKVGEIEDISLNEIRIVNTSIPAHGKEQNRLDIRDVIVNFDLLKLAFERTLKLDVRAISPNIYLSQNSQGNWIDLPAQSKNKSDALKIEVGKIKINNARVVLAPADRNPQPVTLNNINIDANVDDSQEQVKFNGGALFGLNGNVEIQGSSLIKNGATQVAVKGEKLDAAAATRIVKIPEVKIANGTVDGKLDLAIQPQKNLRINSNLLVRDGKLNINNVPRSLDAINGNIQVSEQEVKFNNVKTKYDRVAGVVNGNLNYTTGYQLSAKTTPVSLPDIVKSIDVQSPFSLVGAAVGQLKLTGKLDRPILAGKFQNSQPSQVDRVSIDRVNGNFRLADGRIKLNAIAQPKLGGEVTTQGEIQLLKTPQTRFQVRGDNLPGDTLIQLYGAKLPPQVTLGNATLLGTIGGAGTNIYTNLKINTPQSTFPGLTNLQITPQGKALIKDTTLQVAGGKVNVTGKVDATNWQLNLQPKDLDTRKLAKIGGMNLPVNCQGKLAGNIQAAGLSKDLEIDRIQASGRLNLQLAAGKVEADRIILDRGKWQANIRSEALNLQQLDRSLPTGIASGNLTLNGAGLKQMAIEKILAQGRGKVKVATGTIESNDLKIANGRWQGIFSTNNLQIAKFNPQVRGQLNGKFNLAGNLTKFTPESIRGTGVGTLNLPQGKIVSNNFQIDRGKWQSNLQLSSLILGGLVPQITQKFRSARLDGNVNVAGDLKHLKLQDIALAGDGKLSLAGGTILAKQLELKSGKWGGQLVIDRLKLGSVSEQIPPGFATAKLSGNFNFNVNGDLERLKPEAIQTQGSGKVKLLNGGEIVADNFQLESGQWQSDLTIRGLKLGVANQNLPKSIQSGLLSGIFQANGNLQKIEPAQIGVSGDGNINNLLGGKIKLDNLTLNNGKWQSNIIADRLNIRELAKFAPKQSIDPSLLSGKISTNWEIEGDIKNNNPAKFRVSGDTKIADLRVGSVKFEPNLIGKIQANPGQGVEINFAGNTNRLGLSLDRDLQPKNFRIDRQEILATGTVIKDPASSNDRIVNLNVRRFPIALLQQWIPKSAGIQQYRLDGAATGNLALNPKNFQVTGNQIDIINPIFGAFQGDRLLTNFQYKNGQLNLNNTEIQRGQNKYLINASVNPTAKKPTFQARLQVSKGSLEDVRNILQIFSVDDLLKPFNQRTYGTVADLYSETNKIANRPQPLYNELRRLSELRRWLNRETDRQQASAIPDLRNLKGDFSGELAIASNPKTGLSADFNLKGERWQVDRYHLDRLQAVGNWHDGKLQLQPLTVAVQNSQMTVAGNFGLNNETANVNLQNLPVKWLTNLIELPVEVDGDVNLSAQISGNLAKNPSVKGDLALSNPQLNQTKLQYAAGSFAYANGRLNFDSSATFIKDLRPTIDDLITITGSIPYQLPFTLQAPINNDLNIDVSLQNQGLQIIDVLSKKQLHWIDGRGKIDLKIDGKMKPDGGIESLFANGNATINQGIIQSVAIPEPLSEINGNVVFDFDRIDVKKLAGKFTRGQIAAAGILPISDSFSIEPTKQLNIITKGIAVDLPTKYRGDVDGNLTILGTAFNPILTGDLKLSNGQISLPDDESSNQAAASATLSKLEIKPATPKQKENSSSSLQFRDLQIELGDNTQITRAPILNFLANGNLTINGTLDNPLPLGQVQLQKGSVNLFTTQFRLASGPQTADFFPTLGLEPILNLRLYSKILQSTSSPLSQRNSIARTPNNSSEIDVPAQFATSSLGSVRTVQVEARIAGLASQLTQRLELTSSPALTQSEIVLLLGGGLVEQIGTGDNIGLGIVNLASSNLLSTIQDRLSDLFRLSDFRLFPTPLRDTVKNNSTSTFGIAAEVGTEITPKVSASIFKILTNSESPFYSLRYRLSDQLLLRGSTNLLGENLTFLELEQRF